MVFLSLGFSFVRLLLTTLLTFDSLIPLSPNPFPKSRYFDGSSEKRSNPYIFWMNKSLDDLRLFEQAMAPWWTYRKKRTEKRGNKQGKTGGKGGGGKGGRGRGIGTE